MKNTAGGQRTKPGPRTAPALVSALIWGANLWLIIVGWPSFAGAGRVAEVAASTLWLLPLLAAAALWIGGSPEPVARAALFVGYPALLAVGACTVDAAQSAEVLDAVGLLVATSCAWAYLGAVARLPERDVAAPAVRLSPLPHDARPTAPGAPWTPRRLAAPVMAVGALAIVLVAPTVGGPRTLHAAFGPAAGPASVLVAVVATGLGCALCGYFLADALRPAAAAKPGALLRAATNLMLALIGLTTYFVLRRQ